ncbi:MAG: bifunctional acetate--CoA ligase family protein/GNAT family N-acetyltransferase, partial [Rhodospirillaceae bacterium]|nr:bifunctional acetate--CoA ligase family protein/GNAT family N-acetyltransferase [Rhodospirillaceae bacterium]
MSIRNLDYLFKPKSIAVIGASKRAKSVGAVLSHNLLNAGFDGPVMPVNPRETSIESTLAYSSVADLPMAPDLAVICTPPATVPGLIQDLTERGTRAAVVVTAGFGEGGSEEGKRLMQQTLDAARPTLTRIVGPNCLGIMVPHLGVNASFSHINPLPGNLAFVTQSGAVATAVIDWATNRDIGFSHVVSLGDMGDVDFGDLLDYLVLDPNTRGILMYIESVTDARKFMSAGRAAARAKPVIVIKSGRNEAAAKAAASHTGALAGSDEVYDAAFRRAGMLRVYDLDELFDAVETLAMGLKLQGDRLAIVTNGGGIGVLATESLVDSGGNVAEIAPETTEKLNTVLPPTWSHGNPIDIIGDATGKRYSDALDIVLEDPNQDAVLVLNCPAAVADSLEAAHALIENLKRKGRVPVLTSWVGAGAAVEARRMFATNHIPTYETPGKAARAVMHMVNYKRNQELLLQTPPSIPDDFKPDTARAERLILDALADDRVWLTEPEAKAVLDAYGIPVVATRSVATPQDAAEAAAEIGKPVALKILSTELTHKSDVGGVRLNLITPDAVREAAESMLDTVAHMAPGAKIDGFTVQEMAHMPGAHELIVGIADDRLFGPILLFGQGGTAVEVIKDKAISLPPLNMVLAYEMMKRTRVWKLLQGYRSRPKSDLDAIAMTLVKISQLVCDLSSVEELDINPLFASEKGVLALDARIKIRQPVVGTQARRLAIRPYPKRLEKHVSLRDGRSFFLRPIRPEDEPMIQDMLAHSTENDIRLRFFTPLKQLTHEVAARMSQIDYNREMALVAEGPTPADESSPGGAKALFGVVRISADPDNDKAEYAVMVRSDLKGMGLGYLLMGEIIEYAKERGLQEIFGEVLRENTTMLKMCEELGFKRTNDPDDPGIVHVQVKMSEL